MSDLEALADEGVMDVYLVDAAVNASPLLPVLDAVLGGRRDKPSLSGAVRPELVDAEAAQRLARIGMVEAEVGVQAVDPQVLSNIRRPARVWRVRDGIARLRQNGIRVSADCILGLPGDTETTVQQTIEPVTDREGVDRARFFTLSVLPDTHLRQRADEFALTYQSYPPYLVTGTRELPFDALRSLYRGVLPSARPGRGLLPNPYALVRPPTEGRDPGPAGHGLPVTHVVCDLDGLALWPLMRAAVEQVADGLAYEVHVWLSASDVWARLDEARELLDRLSRPNPFGIWHVVLATRTAPDLAVAEALLRAIQYASPNWVDASSLYPFAQTEPAFQRHAALVYWLDPATAEPGPGQFVHRHIPEAGHALHVGLLAGAAHEVTERLGRVQATSRAAWLVDVAPAEASPEQLHRLFRTAREVQPEAPVLFADWAAQCYWHQHVLRGGKLCGVSVDWFRNCVRLAEGKPVRTLIDADTLSLEGYAIARRLQEG